MAEKKQSVVAGNTDPNHDVIEVKEILFRIDERVKSLIETQSYFRDKIEKVVESNTILSQRINHLESAFDEEKLQDTLNQYREIKSKVTLCEDLDSSMELLEKRVQIVEKSIADDRKQNDIVFGWVKWFFNELFFKICFIVVTTWLLWKFGLK